MSLAELGAPTQTEGHPLALVSKGQTDWNQCATENEIKEMTTQNTNCQLDTKDVCEREAFVFFECRRLGFWTGHAPRCGAHASHACAVLEPHGARFFGVLAKLRRRSMSAAASGCGETKPKPENAVSFFDSPARIKAKYRTQRIPRKPFQFVFKPALFLRRRK